MSGFEKRARRRIDPNHMIVDSIHSGNAADHLPESAVLPLISHHAAKLDDFVMDADMHQTFQPADFQADLIENLFPDCDIGRRGVGIRYGQ